MRQTWLADPHTDICFVYTLTERMLGDLQSGKFPRAASVMERVADHYGIPSIHMGLEVARMEKEGQLVFKAPKPSPAERIPPRPKKSTSQPTECTLTPIPDTRSTLRPSRVV